MILQIQKYKYTNKIQNIKHQNLLKGSTFPSEKCGRERGGGAHLDKNFQAHVTFPNSIAGLEIVYQRPKGNNKSCFLQPVIYWEFDDQID